MTAHSLTRTSSATAAPSLPGTWKLGAGRAISLQPAQDGALRIAHGCVWATFDGPHGGPANDLGDYVVGSGTTMQVHANQRLVLQAWDDQRPAYFSWEPAPEVAHSVAADVPAEVLQPLADLRTALDLGLGAVARLAAGVGRLAWGLVAPRGRLADCALNAHSKAGRAHCAMS
ncbi:MAG: DUF2917 domain-containing protein [Pseudomonadota bacterium]